jgi:anaerobic ribonucleoside-triphosphate reductase activating protein
MIFSGYRIDELRRAATTDSAIAELLSCCDLLVDGPFDRNRPERMRRWLGSRNQQLHFLSNHYAPDDPRLLESNTIELRWSAGQLTVNGWPLSEVLDR